MMTKILNSLVLSVALLIQGIGGNGGIGGKGGIGGGPRLRGSSIQAVSATNYTVTWPSGTIAGDRAAIFYSQGCPLTNATVPTGWATYNWFNLSNWNGEFLTKVLSSGDISTGSVVLPAQCNFDGVVAVVTFIGPTGGVRVSPGDQNAGGVSSQTSTAVGTVTNDILFYWCTNRSNTSNTSSRGALLQTATTGSAGYGRLYVEVTSTGGTIANTCDYSPSTAANWSGIFVFEP